MLIFGVQHVEKIWTLYICPSHLQAGHVVLRSLEMPRESKDTDTLYGCISHGNVLTFLGSDWQIH